MDHLVRRPGEVRVGGLPMHFIRHANPGRARHWWLRVGTSEAAARPGHGANQDPGDFMRWIGEVTGYRR
ncbi:hypothetical protein SSPO_043170 [Streptomyces antimycoticus]|uniref:Uncharacterized protein n=1 Tax=Streptomyces antimycoticus TaxID=68175 RepID=A0A499UY07_9ACTN|nr:hypothetical protein SSPO_043170 [Streptomyces antimycoticus]